MKRIVKKNQIILTLLAVMVAVAGYLNYAARVKRAEESDKNNSATVSAVNGLTDISEEDILLENQAAGSTLTDVDAFPEDDPSGESGEQISANAENSGTDGESLAAEGGESGIPSSSPGEAILTNGISAADYVASVQLSREQMRARNKETLLSVINNPEISEELKQSAVSMMVKMTELADLEGTVEMLLSAKGFDSSVVSISNDQMVDVVVSRYELSDAERAQIEDIVVRKTGIGVENIVITLMDLAEE